MSAPPRKVKKIQPKQSPVICASRRTDLPANQESLDDFLAALKVGSITFDHPHFAGNRENIPQLTRSLNPTDVAVISWWSKDYAKLINAWEENRQVLGRYNHHFTFTINGESASLLEPGVRTPLAGRLEQLSALVALCRSLGQNPNASIMVHVDPISVYITRPDGVEHDTLDHIPQLCAALQVCGLTRIHISFTQFTWRTVRSRLNALSDKFELVDLSLDRQMGLLRTRVFPHTTSAGIQLQTCTAIDAAAYGTEKAGQLPPPPLITGACVGRADIIAITPQIEEKYAIPKHAKSTTAATRNCTCYPFTDVGTKHNPCTHGCRYCFMNPEKYAF
jgi:hypothetical protein